MKILVRDDNFYPVLEGTTGYFFHKGKKYGLSYANTNAMFWTKEEVEKAMFATLYAIYETL